MKNHPSMGAARLATDQTTVLKHFQEMVPLSGCAVLEVGGRLDAEVVKATGASDWWSVDPRNPPLRPEGVLQTICGVASEIPLPDESADHVFSSNAFQHIHDLPESLAELSRVLRPGGYLYANFGPIWSGPDGSHIEDLVIDQQRYDFWSHALLPSWSHLVFDEDELLVLLSAVHRRAVAVAICAYVFHSSWINRLSYREYQRILEQSPLALVSLGGSSEVDYDYCPPQINHPLAKRLESDRLPRELQQRGGLDWIDAQIRDVELILRKSESVT